MNQERIMGNSSTYGEADQHVEHFRKEEKEMVYTIDYYKQNAEELKEMLHQSRMENKRLRLLFGQGDQYDDCPGEQGAFDQKERWCQKFVLKNKHNVEEQNTTSDERRKLCEAYSELMAEFRNLQMLTKKQSEVIQNLTCHKQQNICPESIPIQCTDLEASEALQVTSYTRFPSHGLLLLQGAKTELSATQAWAEKQVKIEDQQIIHVPQADLKPPPPFKTVAPETTSSVAVSPSRTAYKNGTMYTGIRHIEPSQHDEDISGDNENFLQTVDSLSILGLKRPPPDSDYLNPFINSTTHEHLCEEIRGFPLKPKALCKTTALCVASNKKSSSSTIEKRVMPKGIAKHQGTDTDHDIPARFPQIGKERKDVKVPSTEDIGNICLTPRSIGTDEFAFIARTCPICTIVIYVRPGNEDEMQHHVNTHLDNDLGQ